jgi:hypothetical protein
VSSRQQRRSLLVSSSPITFSPPSSIVRNAVSVVNGRPLVSPPPVRPPARPPSPSLAFVFSTAVRFASASSRQQLVSC